MNRRCWMTLASALFLAAGFATARAESPRLISIETPRGVTQAFILIKPDKPVASVILFAGGHGALGLHDATSMRWGAKNFLVRTREKFAAQGLVVAVVDAPSDRQRGMNAIFRMSRAHAGDIAAVADYLKKQSDVPVWLVGTSMGSFSAAGGAIGATNVDGLVLTSTLTRSKPGWKIAQTHRNGVASMQLSRVAVPTLIVSHRNDACELTPATGAYKLKQRLTNSSKIEIAILEGGSPPQSEPCEAMAQHGFLGIEDEAVDTIVKFVKAQGSNGAQ